MDVGSYLQFVLALVFVLALIGVLAMVARRLGLGYGMPTRRGEARRLAVAEAIALDGKRRLVLIRRDTTEHLIILGPTTETVVETGINSGSPGAFKAALPPAPPDAEPPAPATEATRSNPPPRRFGAILGGGGNR